MMNTEISPTGRCWCGCGTATGKKSFFAQGHDRKAEKMLIALHHEGAIARMLDNYGYGDGAVRKNLLAAFQEQGS